jgi:hypothetical protein
VADLPSTLHLWDVENGRAGGLGDFTWTDRIGGEVLGLGQIAAAPVTPPPFVADQVNGHGALAFGAPAELGGGTPTGGRNGELVGTTTFDVTQPLSLCVLGRGNAVNLGSLISVGGSNGELAIIHSSADFAATYIGDNPYVIRSTGTFTTSDLFFAILSWEPSTSRMVLSVNGTDVNEDDTTVLVPSNGPIRLGAMREAGGAQDKALVGGRIAACSFHNIALHAAGNEAALAKVLAYYNEYRGV